MTFPSRSMEKISVIESFVQWNHPSDDIAMRDTMSFLPDMRVALSERPVQGTAASVCAVNETQKTLEVHKIEGFSKYHNFKFEVEGIRAWRAYGVGLGRFIPYREVITEHQGPTDLIVHENFFSLKESMFIKIKATFLLLYRRKSPLLRFTDYQATDRWPNYRIDCQFDLLPACWRGKTLL